MQFAEGEELEELSESLLLRTLLLYLDPDVADNGMKAQWSSTQLDALQGTSISVLFEMRKKCAQQFLNLGGCEATLRFVKVTALRIDDLLAERAC